MLDWDTIEKNSFEEGEDRCLTAIGLSIKQRYFELAISANAQPSRFDNLVEVSVDDFGGRSATALRKTYEELNLPRWDDTSQLALLFLQKLSQEFRDALCAELWEAKSLSDSSRNLVVVLLPTIAAVLSLPAAYAAIVIPIAIVLAKAGIRTYCKDYQLREASRHSLEARLEIHRLALMFLNNEKARYPAKKIPIELLRSIEREEKKILKIEREIKSLQV
jgi:hypothetical protein